MASNHKWTKEVDVIIDFNEYHFKGQVMLKELAMISLQPDSNGNFIDKHYIFKPPCPWKEVPLEDQNNYLRLLEDDGIPWQLGYTNPELQKSIIAKCFLKAKCIYVIDLEVKELLTTIMGKINIPFGYFNNGSDDHFEYVYKTKCVHHQNRDKNNCAYDNVIKMKHILLSTT
ncbi:putative Bracovirus particle protein MdBV-1-12 [Microplitis demolitor]